LEATLQKMRDNDQNFMLLNAEKLDKKMIDDLIATEKNSPEYFEEWLKLQEQATAAK
jgi:hypothetical protein